MAKEKKKFVVLQNESRYEIVSEDGKYVYCEHNRQFRKLNPDIRIVTETIVAEEKTEKKDEKKKKKMSKEREIALKVLKESAGKEEESECEFCRIPDTSDIADEVEIEKRLKGEQ